MQLWLTDLTNWTEKWFELFQNIELGYFIDLLYTATLVRPLKYRVSTRVSWVAIF